MVRIPGKMFPVAVEYAPVDGAPLTSRANKTDSYLGRTGGIGSFFHDKWIFLVIVLEPKILRIFPTHVN